ncbi:Reticulon [Handroanthus impetiginosus]|uniref:Reticulon-like protein n=1 Tax=Handroanthus impetiginosus TaxID=429701 RepID=A0A2G9H2H1_9LAMI|nr:Reticulon [Handroanthus impetiginosus]
MKLVYMDNSSDKGSVASTMMFGRQRPMHAVLGGGKVADVVLWRDRRISASTLIGIAAIWYLFEVAGYSLVTLLCHIFITTMLIIFIWSSAAKIFNWSPPDIPNIILQDSIPKEIASNLHRKFNDLLSDFLYVASGHDPKLFLMTIISLWIISIIGSYISTLNLLFFGLVSLQIVPLVCEQYEDEVEHLAYEAIQWMKKMYKKFEAEIMGKIPRGPVKDKEP